MNILSADFSMLYIIINFALIINFTQNNMSFTKNILLLLASPAEGWKSIKKYNVPAQVMLTKVYFPLLAILSITAFVAMFYKSEVSIAYCIQKAIIEFAKFFLGYHLSSYILTGFFPNIAHDTDSANRVNIAILYNLTILVTLNIIENLLPAPWLFLKIFYVYIFFVSSKCADYLGIDSNNFFKYLIPGFAIAFQFFIGYILDISLSLTTA